MSVNKNASKFLSLILRHKPDLIGVAIDSGGWVEISELILKARKFGVTLTVAKIINIVNTSDKCRFAISSDGNYIRANQGHSFPVDLCLPEKAPPEFLFHGTALCNLSSIRNNGISCMSRTFVHLSEDNDTAIKVGRRHGYPVILQVYSGKMQQDGFKFYLSENGVWMTKHVPVNYIGADFRGISK